MCLTLFKSSRRKLMLTFSLALGFILQPLLPFNTPRAIASEVSTDGGIVSQVTFDNGHPGNPDVYGNYIVYYLLRNNIPGIYMYNISTGVETQITKDSNSNPWVPAIFGDKIVWYDTRNRVTDVYMYNISTGVETRVTNNSRGENGVDIYGNKIIWAENSSNGNDGVYIYDIITGDVTRISNDYAVTPKIYGNKVVWQGVRNRDGIWNVYMYNISTGVETQITNNSNLKSSADIYGNKIVWTESQRGGNMGIFMYDISTGVETQITSDSLLKTAIYKDKIVWFNYKSLNIYDIKTGVVNQITQHDNSYDPYSALAINSDKVVWIDNLNGGNQDNLYMYQVLESDVTAPSVPTVDEVTDKSTSVTGAVEVGATITVKIGTTILGTDTTTDDETFSVTIPEQKAGTKLMVTATDDVGNVSEAKEVTVKDVTAPSAPTVNEVTDASTSVTGTAEANTNVYVTVGSTAIGKGKTDSTGMFSVAVPVQKAGTRVSVRVRDIGGNNSPYTTVTVQDKMAPLAPK